MQGSRIIHPNELYQTQDNVKQSRRNFIKMAGAGLFLTSFPAWAKSILSLPERNLAFYNTHTGESSQITYWEGGTYIPDALAELNHLLRDHRTNQVTQIDHRLFDLLHALKNRLDANQPFHIISGYRSPATNASLSSRSGGVAKKSLHMQGKAIDIRLPKCALPNLRRAAVSLRGGGVGYYPGSNFVHVDVGRVRYW